MITKIRSHKLFRIPFVDILVYIAFFILMLIVFVPNYYSGVHFNKFVKYFSSYIPMIVHLADKTNFPSITKIVLSFSWLSGISFSFLYLINLFLNYKKKSNKCNLSNEQISALLIGALMFIFLLYIFKEIGDKNIADYGPYAAQFISSLTGSKVGLFFNSYFVFFGVFSLVFLLNSSLLVIFLCIYHHVKGERSHGRK